LGVAFVLLVVLMWVGSSELMQAIFTSDQLSYNKPFFITYLDCSLFLIYLFGFLESRARVRTGYLRWLNCVTSRLFGSACLISHNEEVLWRCVPPPDPRDPCAACADWIACRPSDADSGLWQHLAANPLGCRCPPSESNQAEEEEPPASPSLNDEAVDLAEDGEMWSAYTVAKISAMIMPFFFIANWLFNESLVWTSVASNTILSSTSGIWTLIISASIGVDLFSLPKIVAVSLSFCGSAMVALSDSGSSSQQRADRGSTSDAVVGDVLALLSACVYALYAILMKRLLPDETKVSLFMFFGFLGFFSLVLMWPLFIILDLAGIEEFELPPAAVIPALLLNAFVGTVISDMFWLASVLLTSPLITTLGTGLSIPVAMIFDYTIHGSTYSLSYSLGACLVIVGFLLVNLDEYFLSPLLRKLSIRSFAGRCDPSVLKLTNAFLCPHPIVGH
ncbi:MAG: DMT family transporter, partial [archaeon]|nr:DMT family transporter [archaeon]